MWQQKLWSRPSHRHRFCLMGLGRRTLWLLRLVVLLTPSRWLMVVWLLLQQCQSSSFPSLHHYFSLGLQRRHQ